PARALRNARPSPASTPHREALIRQAQESFASEHLAYGRLAAEPHRQVMAGRARLAAARSALEWAASAFDRETGMLAERPGRRRLGEEDQPGTVIAQRRRRDFEKLLDRARAGVTRAEAEVRAIEGEVAGALHEAEQHHQAAVIRVHRQHEYVHRRLARYRRALVRAHPDGAWVNLMLGTPAPEIPGWALPDAYGPVAAVPEQRAPPEDGSPEPAEEADSPEIIPLRAEVTRFGSREVPGDDSWYHLDAAIAADCHWTITRKDGRLELETRSHDYGPYIDGRPVLTATLERGDYFDFAEERYTMADASTLERARRECDLIAADLNATTDGKARLTHMSFVQRKDSVLAVIGPSGAGKSSLFKVLLGELPLESGRLLFQRMSMDSDSAEIRKRLGFVPQDTDLHMSLTVEATLRYGFGLRSDARRTHRDRRIKEALKIVHLADKVRKQRLSTLSGGQLRRVSIALELLTDPPLLMLDEPTSGLDAHMDREVMQFLHKHARADGGHAVIVVTHATEHLYLADQVLAVVDDGRPAYSGRPQRIRRHFGARSYADLMEALSDRPRKLADDYLADYLPVQAAREAGKMEQEAAGAKTGQPVRAERRRVPRTAAHRFRILLTRQCHLVISRGAGKKGRLARTRGAGITSMPLLVAAVSALLAALVAGAPGLGQVSSPAAPDALALLTTLCVLSGQALTYSDVVSELEIIRREFRAGVSALWLLSAKWLVYAVLAVVQAGVITVMFCLWPHRAPAQSLLVGPEADLFITLAALSVSAMTLGLLVSALAANLEQAVAVVTLTSIIQIALNGVTTSLATPSFSSVLAWPLPDRWGVAAVASAVNLLGSPPGRPGIPASGDALWRHAPGHLYTDLGWLAGLSAAFFAIAVCRLHRRLRPQRAKRASQAALSTPTGSASGQAP
ncbi:MAG: ATP-binding cassette domain-containing protein, partial [Actinomycetota bacterium]|nr:ATP-binding cassette domain-containing protein [Actinomycetota bacterium]